MTLTREWEHVLSSNKMSTGSWNCHCKQGTVCYLKLQRLPIFFSYAVLNSPPKCVHTFQTHHIYYEVRTASLKIPQPWKYRKIRSICMCTLFKFRASAQRPSIKKFRGNEGTRFNFYPFFAQNMKHTWRMGLEYLFSGYLLLDLANFCRLICCFDN
jgi:hypothetical protein